MKPLTLALVREIAVELAGQDTPIALRDRAIVLVGFASALRSANLVALDLADVEFVEEGVRLRVRKEKQDQEGKGRWLGIPHGKHPETCAVKALREWIGRGGWFPGPLFTRFDNQGKRRPLQAERICQIVQACLRGIGRDPRGYGSHSMRAGFVTEAGLAGAQLLLIAQQTGHRDMSVLQRYFRRDVFRSNVCGLLDL
jgi:integrase